MIKTSRILTILTSSLLLAVLFLPFMYSGVYSLTCSDGTTVDDPIEGVPSNVFLDETEKQEIRENACKDNGGYTNPTNIAPLTSETIESDCNVDTRTGAELNSENCEIIKYLVIGINFLSAIAGMVIVGSIMFAGYQYMTARDNPGQIEAAKKRIIWALIALGLFIFMYALLNFLVPGGVL